jgi:hypothetical protein
MTNNPTPIAAAATVSFDDEDLSVEVKNEQVLHSIGNIREPSFASFCCQKGKYFLPLGVLVGVIAGVILVLQPSREDIPFADFVFFRDGWEGLTAEELPRWNTRGAGVLKIEMLNALEEEWQPYFDQAIQDWNNGDPDVIDLTVTKVDPNSECDFVSGKYS